MKSFNFNMNQNVVFGVGAIKELPKMLEAQGASNVMIVTGNSTIRLGYIDPVKEALESCGVKYHIVSGVEANPSVETVNRAFAEYQECGAQALLAFGGGSPMDVAKAVAVLAQFGGKITDYEGWDKVPGKVKPIIAIPTTAGTGSEVTASSVITDHERHFKFSITTPKIIPENAILDPNFLLKLPAKIAAATGVDAFVHALESYISIDANPFTDAMAEKAMKLLGSNIRAFVADRSNVEAACGMMLGSNFAGMAFARAKLGNVHAMAHPLGGYFNIPHGVANAVLLPTIVEYNQDYVAIEKYETLYRAIALDPKPHFEKHMLADEIRSLTASLGIPKNLTELGVDPAVIPAMALDGMKSGNAKVNPRPTCAEDMDMLYRKCM